MNEFESNFESPNYRNLDENNYKPQHSILYYFILFINFLIKLVQT